MKYGRDFFLFCLLSLLPFSAWACSCAFPETPKESYDAATTYAVALVRVNGDEYGKDSDGNPLSLNLRIDSKDDWADEIR